MTSTSIAGGLVSNLLSGTLGSTSTNPVATGTPQTLGKDDFMRLMVAQLQNQDPLNPMDSTQLASQTAQYTSLEQLQNLNTTLTNFATQSVGYSGLAGASALLGKTVTVNGSAVTLDGSSSPTLRFSLPASATTVTLQVQDGSGKVVRTLNLGAQEPGGWQIAFDGLADDGTKLPAGTYAYQAVARDSGGNILSGVFTGAGAVTGVTNQGGTLMLEVGNQRVPLSAVVGVTTGGAF